jgi:hypothetical protein
MVRAASVHERRSVETSVRSISIEVKEEKAIDRAGHNDVMPLSIRDRFGGPGYVLGVSTEAPDRVTGCATPTGSFTHRLSE